MAGHVEDGGNNGRRPVNDSPLFITVLNLINTVSNLLLGGISLVAISFANIIRYPLSVKQHIYLCVIGYVILLAQSVLTISSHTSWARAFRSEDRKVVHMILQILGSILALTGGIISIADNGNLNTAHGIIGLVAMIFTALSLIGGMVNFYSSKMNINPNFVKIFHSVAGCLTLCMAFTSLILGFHEYYRFILGDANANMMISCTVVGLLGTISEPSIGVVRRLSKL